MRIRKATFAFLMQDLASVRGEREFLSSPYVRFSIPHLNLLLPRAYSRRALTFLTFHHFITYKQDKTTALTNCVP